MGQVGSKAPFLKAKARVGSAVATARQAASAKLDALDETELDSLSDEELDALLAAEEDGDSAGDTGTASADLEVVEGEQTARARPRAADPPIPREAHPEPEVSRGDHRGHGGGLETTEKKPTNRLAGERANENETVDETVDENERVDENENVNEPPVVLTDLTRPEQKQRHEKRTKRDIASSSNLTPPPRRGLRKVRIHLALPGVVGSAVGVSRSFAGTAFALAAGCSRKTARDVRTRPTRFFVSITKRLCGGFAKAVAHSVLVSSAECFVPSRNLLAATRAGAWFAAARFIWNATMRRNAPSVLALERLSPISFGKASSPSPTERFVCFLAARATRVCESYLRGEIRVFACERAGRAVAPGATRRVAYAAQVAPVVGAYVVKREIINRTTGKNTRRRDAAWSSTHRWGAGKISAIITERGGFFTKIGQLMGTAQQMMPEAYVEAFAKTMDANPPVSFHVVRAKITKSLLETRRRSDGANVTGALQKEKKKATFRDLFEETFLDFDPIPAATASVAQVHFARLRANGKHVAVKVLVADKKQTLSDLKCASYTARLMRWAGLDAGVDFPTVFAAYSDVVEEEFDFSLEARKMREFAALFAETNLADKIRVPEVIPELSSATVLVSRRVRGVKLLRVLNASRAAGRPPRCPPAVATTHATSPRVLERGGGWDGVFHTMHQAWGVMVFRHGHFHCDPHPGNFILQKDGRLAVLDWGQTFSLAPPFRVHLCRLVTHMAGEAHENVAREVRERGEVLLENPSTEALSALCFAYFDTRRTPLAETNLMDLQNSPFLRNRIKRNTREGFHVIRCVFLFRGMMAACGVEASAVEVWDEHARKALLDMNQPVPSVFLSRSRRAATRAWLAAQRALNVGAGGRLNALEAFTRAGNRVGAADDASGGVGGRSATRGDPGTPRRMRSALW